MNATRRILIPTVIPSAVAAPGSPSTVPSC
jgi:hypothetical protein